MPFGLFKSSFILKPSWLEKDVSMCSQHIAADRIILYSCHDIKWLLTCSAHVPFLNPSHWLLSYSFTILLICQNTTRIQIFLCKYNALLWNYSVHFSWTAATQRKSNLEKEHFIWILFFFADTTDARPHGRTSKKSKQP